MTTVYEWSRVLPTTIGFDSIFKTLDTIAANTAIRTPTYPPYNIKKVSDSKYMLELAVAGFSHYELDIQLQENVLSVTGNRTLGTLIEDGVEITYLHKGIAERDFTHKFSLAEHVEVIDAELINGMLKITLARVIPEEKKPKKIPISHVSDKKLLVE
jgi:molecular chaperone IbpA